MRFWARGGIYLPSECGGLLVEASANLENEPLSHDFALVAELRDGREYPAIVIRNPRARATHSLSSPLLRKAGDEEAGSPWTAAPDSQLLQEAGGAQMLSLSSLRYAPDGQGNRFWSDVYKLPRSAWGENETGFLSEDGKLIEFWETSAEVSVRGTEGGDSWWLAGSLTSAIKSHFMAHPMDVSMRREQGGGYSVLLRRPSDGLPAELPLPRDHRYQWEANTGAEYVPISGATLDLLDAEDLPFSESGHVRERVSHENTESYSNSALFDTSREVEANKKFPEMHSRPPISVVVSTATGESASGRGRGTNASGGTNPSSRDLVASKAPSRGFSMKESGWEDLAWLREEKTLVVRPSINFASGAKNESPAEGAQALASALEDFAKDAPANPSAYSDDFVGPLPAPALQQTQQFFDGFRNKDCQRRDLINAAFFRGDTFRGFHNDLELVLWMRGGTYVPLHCGAIRFRERFSLGREQSAGRSNPSVPLVAVQEQVREFVVVPELVIKSDAGKSWSEISVNIETLMFFNFLGDLDPPLIHQAGPTSEGVALVDAEYALLSVTESLFRTPEGTTITNRIHHRAPAVRYFRQGNNYAYQGVLVNRLNWTNGDNEFNSRFLRGIPRWYVSDDRWGRITVFREDRQSPIRLPVPLPNPEQVEGWIGSYNLTANKLAGEDFVKYASLADTFIYIEGFEPKNCGRGAPDDCVYIPGGHSGEESYLFYSPEIVPTIRPGNRGGNNGGLELPLFNTHPISVGEIVRQPNFEYHIDVARPVQGTRHTTHLPGDLHIGWEVNSPGSSEWVEVATGQVFTWAAQTAAMAGSLRVRFAYEGIETYSQTVDFDYAAVEYNGPVDHPAARERIDESIPTHRHFLGGGHEFAIRLVSLNGPQSGYVMQPGAQAGDFSRVAPDILGTLAQSCMRHPNPIRVGCTSRPDPGNSNESPVILSNICGVSNSYCLPFRRNWAMYPPVGIPPVCEPDGNCPIVCEGGTCVPTFEALSFAPGDEFELRFEDNFGTRPSRIRDGSGNTIPLDSNRLHYTWFAVDSIRRYNDKSVPWVPGTSTERHGDVPPNIIASGLGMNKITLRGWERSGTRSPGFYAADGVERPILGVIISVTNLMPVVSAPLMNLRSMNETQSAIMLSVRIEEDFSVITPHITLYDQNGVGKIGFYSWRFRSPLTTGINRFLHENGPLTIFPDTPDTFTGSGAHEGYDLIVAHRDALGFATTVIVTIGNVEVYRQALNSFDARIEEAVDGNPGRPGRLTAHTPLSYTKKRYVPNLGYCLKHDPASSHGVPPGEENYLVPGRCISDATLAVSMSYQWELMRPDGSGYDAIPGATEDAWEPPPDYDARRGVARLRIDMRPYDPSFQKNSFQVYTDPVAFGEQVGSLTEEIGGLTATVFGSPSLTLGGFAPGDEAAAVLPYRDRMNRPAHPRNYSLLWLASDGIGSASTINVANAPPGNSLYTLAAADFSDAAPFLGLSLASVYAPPGLPARVAENALTLIDLRRGTLTAGISGGLAAFDAVLTVSAFVDDDNGVGTVSYQWEWLPQGASGEVRVTMADGAVRILNEGDSVPIPGATLSVLLNPRAALRGAGGGVNLGPGNRQDELRASVRHVDDMGFVQSALSPGESYAAALEGTGLVVDGIYAAQFGLTANTGGIEDLESGASVKYQWEIRLSADGSFLPIADATLQTYRPTADDALAGRALRATVEYVNADGALAGQSAEAQRLSAALSLNAAGRRIDAHVSPLVGGLSYAWSEGAQPDSDHALLTDETGTNLVLPGRRIPDFGPHVILTVSAQDGTAQTFVSASLSVSPVRLVGLNLFLNGPLRPGATLRVVGGLSGGFGGFFSYEWTGSGSDRTSQQYILEEGDFGPSPLTVRVQYEDPLGFASSRTASFASLTISISLDLGDALLTAGGASLPLAERCGYEGFYASGEAADAGDCVLRLSALNLGVSILSRRWQHGEGGAFADIAGATGETYRNSAADYLQAGGFGPDVRAVASYQIGGDSFEAVTEPLPVRVLPRREIEDAAGITVNPPSAGSAASPVNLRVRDRLGNLFPASVFPSHIWHEGDEDDPLSGAPEYVLTAGLAPMTLHYLGGVDLSSPSSGRYLGISVVLDRPSEGSVAIAGDSFAPGHEFTADIGDIRDENGVGSFEYRWELRRSGSSSYAALPSGASSVYVLVAEDFANASAAELRVSAGHADGLGFAHDSPFYATVAFAQSDATGELAIGGSLPQVSADVSGVSDVNGTLSYRYQWERGGGGSFAAIPGATQASYSLLPSDIGDSPSLRLAATARDPLGGETALTSPALEVSRLAPSGLIVSLNGALRPGATLHAIASLPEGSGGELSYAWTGSGSDLTSSEYVLEEDDFGPSPLTVRAEYEDALGFASALTASFASLTAEISLDLSEALRTASGTSLPLAERCGHESFYAAGEAADENDCVLRVSVLALGARVLSRRWQHGEDGGAFADVAGAAGETYRNRPADYLQEGGFGPDARAAVRYEVGTSIQEAFTEALPVRVFPRREIEGAANIAVSSPTAGSAASPVNLRVRDRLGNLFPASVFPSHIWHGGNEADPLSGASEYVLTAGLAPMTLHYLGGISLSSPSPGRYLGISVVIDSPSEGAAVIAGESFAPGHEFTANIGGISDANGVGSFEYRWELRRSGSLSYAALPSGSSSVYVLAAEDFADASSAELRVSVGHADGLGFVHASPFYATVAFAQSDATGELAIGGSLPQVTADVSGVSDVNGALSYSYQWERGSGGSFAAIPGATQASYLLSPSDLGDSPSLRLAATARDPLGGETALISPALAVPRSALSGLRVSLNGALRPGATLHAIATLPEGAGGELSYAWTGSGTDLTSSEYVLEAGDFTSSPLTVRAEYEDALGFNSILTATFSSLTAAISLDLSEALRTASGMSLPLAERCGYEGFYAAGEAADAGDCVLRLSVLALGVRVVAQRWQQGEDGGAFADIAGASGEAYRNSPADYLQAGGFGPDVRAVASYQLGGDSFEAFTETLPVRVFPRREIEGAANIAISSPTAGSAASPVNLRVRDRLGNLFPASLFPSHIWHGGNEADPLSGSSEYVLTAGLAPMTLYYLGGVGLASASPGRYLGISVVIDSPSEGAAAIAGESFAPGHEFTANIGGISDANGVGSFEYRWELRRSGSPSYAALPSGSSSVYVLAAEDFADASSAELRVSAGHADGLGFANASPFYATVAFAQSDAVGELAIGGSLPQVTADISGVSDVNGTLSYSYQWEQGSGGSFIAIPGATQASYSLSPSDLGDSPSLRLAATARDPLGGETALTSPALAVPRSALSGLIVSLNGALRPGATLHAIASLPEGSGGDLSYAWTGSGTDLTSSEYVLEEGDFTSSPLTVRAEYEDALGFNSILTASFASLTAEISLDLSEALRTASGTSLPLAERCGYEGFYAAGEAADAGDCVLRLSVLALGVRVVAQRWQHGADGGAFADIAGATAEAYRNSPADYLQAGGFGPDARAAVRYEKGSSLQEAFTEALPVRVFPRREIEGAANIAVSFLTAGSAASPVNLRVRDRLGNLFPASVFPSRVWHGGNEADPLSGASEYVLTAGLAPMTLHYLGGAALASASPGRYLGISVVIDSPSEGAVAIAGNSFAPGHEFTADIGGILDANGVGSFEYRWELRRSGSPSYVALPSGSSSAYVLAAEDFADAAAAELRVSAGHTDGLGFVHASPFYATVAFAQSDATGELAIGGSLPQVTADVSGVSDVNGALSYSYQWERGGGGSFIAIPGATQASYLLSPSDLGDSPLLRLAATARDPLGGETALTSPALAVPRSALSGLVVSLNGSLRPGATLHAIAALPEGAGGDLSYAWTGSGTDLASSEYVLEEGDFTSSPLTVRAEYEDALGFDSTLTATFASLTASISLDLSETLLTASGTSLPLAERCGYEGFYAAGEAADESDCVLRLSVLALGVRVVAQRWQHGADGGAFSDIAGASGETYRNRPADYLQAGGFGPEVRAVASYQIGGDSFEAFTEPLPVRVFPRREIDDAANIAVSSPTAGSAASPVNLRVRDRLGNLFPASVFPSHIWHGGNEADPLSGASEYVLTAGLAPMTLHYLGGISLSSPSPGRYLGISAVLDSPSEGAVAIAGDSFAPGHEFTANIGGILDANGVGSFEYRWELRRSGSPSYVALPSGSSSVYVLAAEDFADAPAAELRVSASHTDGLGFVHASPFYATVAFAQSDAVGELAIGGFLPQVSADVSGVSDVNGTLSYSYQWERGGGGSFAAIPGATQASYLLSPSDLGDSLSLRLAATARDPLGGETSLTSPALAVPRSALSGLIVSLNGALRPGATLHAIAALPEGAGGDLSYAWTGSGTDVTSAEYVLEAGDFTSSPLTVRAEYEDALGFDSTLTASFASLTATISLDLSEALRTASGTTLPLAERCGYEGFYAAGEAADAGDCVLRLSVLALGVRVVAQRWQHGADGGAFANIAGASGETYRNSAADYLQTGGFGPDVRAVASYQLGGDSFEAFTEPLPVRAFPRREIDDAANIAVSSPTAGAAASPVNLRVRDRLGNLFPASVFPSHVWHGGDEADPLSGASEYVLTAGLAPMTLHYLGGVDLSSPSPGRYLGISVVIDSPSEGAVAIAGDSFAPGHEFTADIGGILDANGVGSFEYRWELRRSGSPSYVALPSGSSSAYVLAAEDFADASAAELRVSASHTDGLGFVHASPFYATVAFAQSDATGELAIGGSLPQVTADVSGVSDVNGALSYIYQWERGGGGSFTAIPGATQASYSLSPPDLGDSPSLRLAATARDPLGGETALTSPALAVPRSALSGLIVSLNGDLRPGATLHAVASFSGESGGDLSYAWTGSGTELTSSQYVLEEDDFGSSPLTVRARHEDALGFASSLTASFAGLDISIRLDLSEVLLTASGPSLPAAERCGYEGFYAAGEAADASDCVLRLSVLALGVSALSHRWQHGESGGAFADIAGATGEAYRNRPADYLQAGGFGPDVRAVASYQIGGDSFEAFSEALPVRVLPRREIEGAANIAVSSPTAGAAASPVNLRVRDRLGNLFPASLFPSHIWHEGDESDPLSGASEYVLTSGLAPMTLHYLGGVDLASASPGRYLGISVVLDRPSEGAVAIAGDSFAPGHEFTANIGGILDANGIGSFEYRWELRRSGSPSHVALPSGSSSVYVLAAEDFADAQAAELRVSASHTDGLGFVHASPFYATVAFAQSDATGELAIGGSLPQVLADVSGVSDVNGTLSYSYQWERGSGGSFAAIPGATQASYLLTPSDLGDSPSLRLAATARDPLGGETSLISPALAVPRSALSGLRVSLNGALRPGATLHAVSSLPEGSGGALSYAWAGSGTDLTSSEYVLEEGDFGPSPLTLRARHEDALGFASSLTASFAALTAEIRLDLGEALLTASGTSLPAAERCGYEGFYSAGEAADENDCVLRLSVRALGVSAVSQRWQHGEGGGAFADIAGATGETYRSSSADYLQGGGFGPEVRAVASYQIGGDSFEAFTEPLQVRVLPRREIENAIRITIHPPIAGSAASPVNLRVRDRLGNLFPASLFPSRIWHGGDESSPLSGASEYVLTAGLAPMTLHYLGGIGLSSPSPGRYLGISVVLDRPSEGAVTIAGNSFAPGHEFTADIGGILDANGIGDFQYRWELRRSDSLSYVALPGGASSVYVLAAADFLGASAAELRVSAGHTDGLEFANASPFYATVAFAQSDAVGELAIGGSLPQVSADVSGVSDINGTLSYRYQWERGSGGSFAAIPGATQASYLLSPSDLGDSPSLRLAATAQDPLGGETALISPALEVPRFALSGLSVSLNGVLRPGATLHAVASVPEGGALSYEWAGSGSDLASPQYVLEAEDFGPSPLTLRARHEDALGFASSLTASFAALTAEIHLELGEALRTASGTTLPLAERCSDEGFYSPGEAADENDCVLRLSVLALGVSVLSQRWQHGEEGDAFADIAGATGATYRNSAADYLRAGGFGPDARAAVRYEMGASIREAFAEPVPVRVLPRREIEGAARITLARPQAGETASPINLQVRDRLGNLLPPSLFPSHVWHGGGENAPLSGAPEYVLTAGMAPMTLHYLGGISLSSPSPGRYPGLSVVINRPSEGFVAIAGRSFAPGQSFAADVGAVQDANGVGSFDYQWELRPAGSLSFAALPGASAATYILAASDFAGAAAGELRVSAGHTDGLGFAHSQPFYATVAFAQSAASGVLGINAGGFTLGAPWSADASGLSDANGPLSVFFQWQAGSGTVFADVAGATLSTYLLSLDLAPAEWLRVSARAVDPLGGEGGFVSEARLVNQPVSGQPRARIAGGGLAHAEATLTVDISRVSDANGVSVFSYSWGGGARTADSYILSAEDFAALRAGGSIALSMNVVDDLGFEHVFGPLPFRLLAVDISAGAGLVESSVTDAGNLAALGSFRYQWQEAPSAEGPYSNIAGATEDTYAPPNPPSSSHVRLSLRYRRVAEAGEAFALSNPLRIGGLATGGTLGIAGNLTVASQWAADLSALRDPLGRIPAESALSYQWESGSPPAWTDIAGASSARYALDASGFGTGRTHLRLRANDGSRTIYSQASPIERPSEGSVAVAGGPFAPGQRFEADVSDIRDANGIGVFAYQWELRHPGTPSFRPLNGQSAAAYVLNVADFPGLTAAELRVSVSHADALGFADPPAFYATLVFSQETAQGTVRIVGEGFAPGALRSADVSGLSDANGPLSYSYQWQSGGGDGMAPFTDIPGATNSSYALAAADFAPQNALRVIVRAADPLGGATEIVSEAEEGINRPTEGFPRVTVMGGGDPQAGATLLADVSGIRDENGVGTFEYAWLGAGGETLGNGRRYVLREEDAGEFSSLPRLALRHQDQLGFVHDFGAASYVGAGVRIYAEEGEARSEVIDPEGAIGGFVYQWQRSALAEGPYEEIAGEAGSVYRPPSRSSLAERYVRLMLSYQVTLENQMRLDRALSNPLRIGGIASGRVSVLGQAVSVGASRTAFISDLRDPLSRPLPEDVLGYQWQIGNSGASDALFRDIAGATLRVYQLNPLDFVGLNRYARVEVRDLGDEATRLLSLPEDIEHPTGGQMTIVGETFIPGRTISVDVSGLRDDNGMGTFAYQWEERANGEPFAPLSGGTAAVHTISRSFEGPPSFRVSVLHIDAFGFESRLAASMMMNQSPAAGSVAIAAAGYAHGASVLAQPSITDLNGDERLFYQWQRRDVAADEEFTNIDGATESSYEIDRAHWAPFNELRVRVTHRDLFGEETAFLSRPLAMNRPTEGRMEVRAPSFSLDAGSRLTADLSGVSDENNAEDDARASFEWLIGSRGALTASAGATLSLYVLTARDEASLQRGGLVSVRALYADGLGFASTLGGELSGGLPPSRLQRTALEWLSLAGGNPAESLVEGRELGGIYLIERKGRGRLKLNDEEVDEAEDLTRALSRRLEGTRNAGRPFGVDSIGFEYVGRLLGGDVWHSWARTQWRSVSGGSPLDRRYASYEGSAVNAIVGAGRHFGDDRAGLAFEFSDVDLDADLDGDGSRGDRLERQMHTLLPYGEWRYNRSYYARAAVGIGTGSIVYDTASCDAEVDAETLSWSAQGGYDMPRRGGYDLGLSGRMSGMSSIAGAGECEQGGALPRESLLFHTGAVRLDVSRLWALADSGEFRPRAFVDVSRSFGDAGGNEEQFLYAGGGGFDAVMPARGVSFGADAHLHLGGEAEHERDAFGGYLTYQRGRYSSSLRTALEGGAATHRWELSRGGRWRMNTASTRVYWESSPFFSSFGAEMEAGFGTLE